MEIIKYKVIKSRTQYNKYCDILEELADTRSRSKAIQDEIELLTLLIEKYDEAHNELKDADPVEILKTLMKENQMRAVDLAAILKVSEGLVSDMLNYKKGFSKQTIRTLSENFSLSQEAFNRPYKLINMSIPLPERRTTRYSRVKTKTENS